MAAAQAGIAAAAGTVLLLLALLLSAGLQQLPTAPLPSLRLPLLCSLISLHLDFFSHRPLMWGSVRRCGAAAWTRGSRHRLPVSHGRPDRHTAYRRQQHREHSQQQQQQQPAFTYHEMLSGSPSSPSPAVIVPRYDRDSLTAGIVHFSVGGFHRAHLAYYMDCLLQSHTAAAAAFAICGVGVRQQDRQLAAALKAQHGLYSLTARGPREGQEEVRIVGSLVRYLFAPDDGEALLAQLLSPHTRIVSLTITEAGYDMQQNADTTDDAAAWQQCRQALDGQAAFPKSVFGWIALGLEGRRQRGLPAFAVLSCDNLQHNGEVTKQALLAFAQAAGDAALQQHVQAAVSCPSSMVDRITPAAQPQDVAFVRQRYGIADRCPVLTEDYVQWVLEDNGPASFPAGRPPLELLSSSPAHNLLLVHDVSPYERMKLQLLNASHSAICYLGLLCGHRFIHDVMADPLFVRFMRRLMRDEAAPAVPPVPRIDIARYQQSLIDRFANANTRDTTLRVCMDGASKWSKFLLPTLRHQLTQQQPNIHCSALAIAGWFRYLDGHDEAAQQTVELQLKDAVAEQLGLPQVARESRRRGGDARLLMGSCRGIFAEVAEDERFVSEVQRALRSIYSRGARQAMEQWLQ